ncbi:MAG: hypothetical protein RLY72_1292 [Planctomycetota bacterium]
MLSMTSFLSGCLAHFAEATDKSGLNAEEDTCWHNEALKRVGGAVVPLSDVDDALVGSDFELLTRLLIDERRTVDRVDLSASGQRDRTCNASAGALRLVNDLSSRSVKRLVVVGLHADSEFATSH